jgi:hypothetical protein
MDRIDVGILLAVLVFIALELLSINAGLKRCAGLLVDCANSLESLEGKTPDED